MPTLLRPPSLLLLLPALLLAACDAPPPSTVPEDASVEDAAAPTFPRDAAPIPEPPAPPVIECSPPVRTQPGSWAPVGVTVEDEGNLDRVVWMVHGAPPESRGARLLNPFAKETLLGTDALGEFRAVATVFTLEGGSASCEVIVRATSDAPSAICPEGTPTMHIGETLPIEAEGGSPGGEVVSTLWEVALAPVGGSAEILFEDQPSARFHPMAPGRYRLRFHTTVAGSAAGEERATSNCEVDVLVLGPPVLTCPGPIVRVRAGEEVELLAAATDDNDPSPVTGWALLAAPTGSAATLIAETDDLVRLPSDLPGDYTLRYAATDADGFGSSCDVVVVASEGEPGIGDLFRVEITWLSEDADVDLHMLSPEAPTWFSEQDCFGETCAGERGLPTVEWGAPDRVDDDPLLRSGSELGEQREEIRLHSPAPGTYRIGAHASRVGSEPLWFNIRFFYGRGDTDGVLYLQRISLDTAPGEPDSPETNDFVPLLDVTFYDDGRPDFARLFPSGGQPTPLRGREEASTTR